MHRCQHEAEEHMLAATKHILQALGALGASKYLSDDITSVLQELGSHLSSMSVTSDSKGSEFSQIEERLKCAERTIMHWKSNSSLLWNSGPTEPAEYLQAVNEILTVVESLGGVCGSEKRKAEEMMGRAKHLLHIAMSRLEEEVRHILVQHKQCFEPQYVSIRSPAGNRIYDESFTSAEDEIVEEPPQTESNEMESTEYIADLVNPHVIPDIKSIANVMSACNYVAEFCEAFISTRREALYEYLSVLEMERQSIEDVLKLEWSSLDSEIKKWMWAMKIIIIGYLSSEKWLCDQILGDLNAANLYCFVEISKDSIMCLLNFGQAVAMGPRAPEKLFHLLNMYEVLANIHLHVDVLFSEDNGFSVRIEFHETLSRLGDSARETFLKFGNAIWSDASTQPFPGGGVHHLTKYVMNYINLLLEYRNTMNLLLRDQAAGEPNAAQLENDDDLDISSVTCCPMACHLRAITSTLESNLINKSKLYKDDSLQQIFLINNIYYMVQKVKGSELGLFFGDEWIRKHNAKFQQHATSYVRATWSSVVSILRHDGKAFPKEKVEKCRRFTTAFEEVYKTQTKWHVPDPRLREDLQISISQTVIPAYSNFVGTNSSNIEDKYVKYTADELGNLLLDFFAGPPKSPRSMRRR